MISFHGDEESLCNGLIILNIRVETASYFFVRSSFFLNECCHFSYLYPNFLFLKKLIMDYKSQFKNLDYRLTTKFLSEETLKFGNRTVISSGLLILISLNFLTIKELEVEGITIEIDSKVLYPSQRLYRN